MADRTPTPTSASAAGADAKPSSRSTTPTPAVPAAPAHPVNIGHGSHSCATCNTLLTTISSLETMLQHKRSDKDALLRSLGDAQRVNALLLEQVEMLQRGLERAIVSRPAERYVANTPAQPLAFAPAPVGAAAASLPRSFSPPQAYIPTGVRMLAPNTDVSLRAMADAVLSLTSLFPDKPLGSDTGKSPAPAAATAAAAKREPPPPANAAEAAKELMDMMSAATAATPTAAPALAESSVPAAAATAAGADDGAAKEGSVESNFSDL